jgi:PAS domain S-box-containing protein
MSAEGTGIPAAGSEVSDDLYRRLVESVSVVTFALPFGHADEPFLYVSPQSESLLGLTHEEMMVGSAERVRRIHPEDRGRVLQDMTSFETTGGWDTEYRIVVPDGSVRWIHDRTRLAPATDERPAMWFGVLTPIPDRDESARELADAETRYQALIEQLPAVVYIDTYEPEPVTLYISRQIETLSGYRPEEWIADPELWLQVAHPDDRDDLAMRPDWPAQL